MDLTENDSRLDRLSRRYVPDDGRTGFSLITSGAEAFRTLQGMAAASQRTLDVHYYLWENDGSGRRMLAALLDAADRGGRVRLLLDDIGATRSDPELARLSAYPNVSVRLYNPFPRRFWLVLELLFQARRVSRRMHNKAFVVDRVAAVVGGRNVGDRYFELDERQNFRDLDLFAAGPVVEQIADAFDAFWASSWTRQIHLIDRGRWRLADIRATVRRGLRRRIRRNRVGPESPPDESNASAYRALVRDRFARLVLADDATVVSDAPDKPQTGEARLLEQLLAKIDELPKREVLLEAAYFIPTRYGTDLLGHLARSGVNVRVLTNSAGSGDVALAHSAYRKYRRPLLRAGVELFELRARPGSSVDADQWELNLHTKAAVIDRRDIFIGSSNFDPRSASLNTEIGLFVRSPALAAQVAAFIEDGMASTRSYRPSLKGRRMVWRVDDGDGPRVQATEPGISFWRLLARRLLAFLPLERQL